VATAKTCNLPSEFIATAGLLFMFPPRDVQADQVLLPAVLCDLNHSWLSVATAKTCNLPSEFTPTAGPVAILPSSENHSEHVLLPGVICNLWN